MNAAEVLQWTNLLVIPGVLYVIRLERRIMALEFEIKALIEKLGDCSKGKHHA